MNKLISFVVCVLFVALCKSEIILSPGCVLYQNGSESKSQKKKSFDYLKDECTSYVDLIDNIEQYYENPAKNNSYLDDNHFKKREILNVLIDKVELQQINILSAEFYDF